jgi:hypothetical protein
MKLVHARRLYRLEEALERISDIESRIGGAAGSPAPESGARQTEQRDSTRPAPASSVGRSPQRSPREAVEPPQRPASQPRPAAPPQRATTDVDSASSAGNTRASPAAPARAKDEPPRAATPQTFDEPPPLLEEPYEIERELPPPAARSTSEASIDGADAIDRIKNALEGRRKMLLLTMLNAAESIEVDGDVLRISFPTSGGISKNRVETRENRQMLSEVCQEVFGRPMRLSVSVGAQPKTRNNAAQKVSDQKASSSLKDEAENHPAVRALADKFQGKVVDVIKPES